MEGLIAFTYSLRQGVRSYHQQMALKWLMGDSVGEKLDHHFLSVEIIQVPEYLIRQALHFLSMMLPHTSWRLGVLVVSAGSWPL